MSDDELREIRVSLISSALAAERDHSSGLSRWVVGSLFAMNGAAIISLINLDRVTGQDVRQIGMVFAVGLFAALFASWASAWAGNLSSGKMVVDLWSGEILKVADIKEHYTKISGNIFLAMVAGILSFVSLAIFIYGIIEFADVLGAVTELTK
jgi:hypothetical protein